LKFALFQEKYFSNSFEPEFEVIPREDLRNAPNLITLPAGVPRPDLNRKLEPAEFSEFLRYAVDIIAKLLV